MKVSVVYDEKCPVCRDIVGLGRLRDRTGEVELIDARTGCLESVQGVDISSYDFDEGFVVVFDGDVYHGADAAFIWGKLTDSVRWRFRLFQVFVKTRSRSHRWYPWMKAGRSCLLRILGISRIGG